MYSSIQIYLLDHIVQHVEDNAARHVTMIVHTQYWVHDVIVTISVIVQFMMTVAQIIGHIVVELSHHQQPFDNVRMRMVNIIYKGSKERRIVTHGKFHLIFRSKLYYFRPLTLYYLPDDYS